MKESRGEVFGTDASFARVRADAVEAPWTCPPRTPPPAKAIENTEPQWPRPPLPSRRGLRPNSDMQITRVSSSRPRGEVFQKRGERLVGRRREDGLDCADSWV